MKVLILGSRFEVADLLAASQKVAAIRDCYNYGASQMGAEFPVYDKDNNVVAIVSYNGRVWTPEPHWMARTEIEV